MTITLTLSDETLATLLAEAAAQGRDAGSLAAERLAAWYEPDPLYAPEGSEEELAAIGESLKAAEQGRTKPFDPAAILRKFGIDSSAYDSTEHS